MYCTLLDSDSNNETVNNTNCIRPANRTVSRWRIIRQTYGNYRASYVLNYLKNIKISINCQYKQTTKQTNKPQKSIQFSHSCVCSHITLHYITNCQIVSADWKKVASVNGNIILKWSSRNWKGRAWNGNIWLSKEKKVWLLWIWSWTVGLHKNSGNFFTNWRLKQSTDMMCCSQTLLVSLLGTIIS